MAYVGRRRPGKCLSRPVAALTLVFGMVVAHDPAGAAAEQSTPDTWIAMPDVGPRFGHVAVRMDDGRVLVAGGLDDTRGIVHASAFVFDPTTHVLKRTADMSVPRYQPATALLRDGTVLATGGIGGGPTTDRYLPALSRWLPAAEMSTPRWGHTATVLNDGRLLVTGGQWVRSVDGDLTLSSAEVYDPLLNRWTATAGMVTPRYSHAATLLADGRVLVAGGNDPSDSQLASAEVYDPDTDTWDSIPDMSVPRVAHTVTLLQDGRVLVAGGTKAAEDPRSADAYWSSTEAFDPATGQWRPSGDMVAARAGHTATLLDDGRVFVAGGFVQLNDALATAEVYDPRTTRWQDRTSMSVPRFLHTATLVSGGREIVVVGGWNSHGGATGAIGLYQR